MATSPEVASTPESGSAMSSTGMVAVPVSGDLHVIVVGAPSYFARNPVPKHPRDLVRHDCITWQRSADAASCPWPFTIPGGREIAVGVRARVLTNDPEMNLRLALAGVGLAMVHEGHVRGFVLLIRDVINAVAWDSAPKKIHHLDCGGCRIAPPSPNSLLKASIKATTSP